MRLDIAVAALLSSAQAAAQVPDAGPLSQSPPGIRAELEVTPSDGGFRVAAEAQPDAGPGALIMKGLRPPSLLLDSRALFPPALEGKAISGTVKLQILIGEQGDVEEAEVIEGVHPLLDDAALHAAAGLRFEPAAVDGNPVPVRIFYAFQFLPPPPAQPTPSELAPRLAVLQGLVRAKGLRRPLAGASVTCGDISVETDSEGRFEIKLPEGSQSVSVLAPGHKPKDFRETLRAGEILRVVYGLEPLRINPYETIVRAERERTEVSRVTLRDQELREVPGTMGDPFRVVMLMPGVASLVSGVAYPVVRGTAPASTGYFIDGVRVPILYHLFLGPAVVHPDFLEAVDFYPGAPPPQYGRLMGGVIDGRIAKTRDDRVHGSAYADLINAGGLLEYPLEKTGTNVTLAGRFSYTAWLAALVANSVMPEPEEGRTNPKLVLDFWDYQARVEQRIGPGKLRLFAFGSSDTVGTESDDPNTSAATESVLFHRIDLRYRGPLANGELEAGLTWGIDRLGIDSYEIRQSDSGAGPLIGSGIRVHDFFWADEESYAARASWERELGSGLELQVGGDLEHRRALVSLSVDLGTTEIPEILLPMGLGTFTGFWVQTPWKDGSKRWTVVPGLRLDNYHLVPGLDRFAAEPRLTVRYELTPGFTLKGAAGLFHQQPTTLIQLPIIDVSGLRYGLQEGAQLDAGLEWRGSSGLEVNVDFYFNPLLHTYELNPFEEGKSVSSGGEENTGSVSSGPVPEEPNQLFDPARIASRGKAYGLELLIRHPLGGNWFGWVSYSLQRSTRWTTYDLYDEHGAIVGEASGYIPYAYDQTHVFNAVLSYKFANNWTVGGVLHFNTGRPETRVMTSQTMREGTDSGGNQAWIHVPYSQADRLPPFFRFDLRVSKSWAFDTFNLEAYLDALNVTVSSEVVSFDYTYTYDGRGLSKRPVSIPIVVPILGAKGTY
jgi:TonB family protein